MPKYEHRNIADNRRIAYWQVTPDKVQYMQREGKQWRESEVPIIDTTKVGMPAGHAYGGLWRNPEAAARYMIEYSKIVPGYTHIIKLKSPSSNEMRWQVWYIPALGKPENPIPWTPEELRIYLGRKSK